MESSGPERDAAAEPAWLGVRGLVCRYGERVALDGLSFAVRKGEVFGLLGPNGSGKSTAFQVLTGVLLPAAGEVHFRGAVLSPGDRRLRSELGVVFQSPSLDARLSARENLRLGAALYGVPRALARERGERLLRLAELDARADEPVARFSGGMRRRLELCRALVHGPSVLLLDEPTTGLDEASFQRWWEKLLELRAREGTTVLVITHRPEEAERCDRLAVMDRGRVIAEGTPERLRQRVAGDVLTLEADGPGEVAARVRERFGVAATVVDDRVVIVRERGHELVPRIVEAFPAGRLRAVAMRRAGLAEVFVELTGRVLE